MQISNVGGGTVACNTTGFCVILCWPKAIPTVWTVSKVNCFSVLDSNILEIFSHLYRSPFVPWTHRPRWSGTWLWQHLGIWLWYWNDSANVWKFNTPDRIRLWGQGRHGNTAEMVIKKTIVRHSSGRVQTRDLYQRDYKKQTSTACCCCSVQWEPQKNPMNIPICCYMSGREMSVGTVWRGIG